AHLEVRRQLNGIRRAGFFAEATEDAAREVDAEEFWVASASLVLGGLQGNTVHWARYGTEIAGDTALPAVRIPRQNNTTAPAWGQVRLLLRILGGGPPSEQMQKHLPHRPHQTQHALLPLSLMLGLPAPPHRSPPGSVTS